MLRGLGLRRILADDLAAMLGVTLEDLSALAREERVGRHVGADTLRDSEPWTPETNRGWAPLHCASVLARPFKACLAAAGIAERFTVHELRRTFVDLARRAEVDPDEQRAAVGAVVGKVIPLLRDAKVGV